MGASSSQIRLLLVEDVAQVAQYIRNLLNSQDQVKLLVLAFFDASDGVIEIVTNDATTLRNSRIMAETFTAIGYARDRRHYLVNRADATGGVDARTVAEQLGGEPEFHLVSDGRLVVEANNQGVPFVLVEPGAHISQEMTHIATSLLTTRVAIAAGAR